MSWETTGLVAVTAGEPTVTGTGTLFASRCRIGDAFNGPDGVFYEIINIASDTVLAIHPAYMGSSATGQGYQVVPVRGYSKKAADHLHELLRRYAPTFDALNDLPTWLVDGTSVPITEGGTGARNAEDARSALGLGTLFAGKVDKVVGKELSTNDYTTAEKNKLTGIAAGATKNKTDAHLLARANHTGVQAISTVTGLQGALDDRVDKVVGKELSTNDYTTAEKNKLTGIAAGATKNRSDATMDTLLSNKVDKITDKDLSTNDYTNLEKAKLAGIADEATANQEDVHLLARANHTGVQAISTVTGLQGALDSKAASTHTHPWSQITSPPAQATRWPGVAEVTGLTAELATYTKTTDPRLSNSREWIAPTVPLEDALAGISTSRSAWTAERVKQAAIAAVGVATPPPAVMTVTYDAAGRVTKITEDVADTDITYNADGTVSTVAYPRGDKLRTETYSYSDGQVTGMTAVEV